MVVRFHAVGQRFPAVTLTLSTPPSCRGGGDAGSWAVGDRCHHVLGRTADEPPPVVWETTAEEPRRLRGPGLEWCCFGPE